jgi:hypothetical protein
MQFYAANKLPSQTSLSTIIILSNKLHICTVEETVNLLLRNFRVCTHIHQSCGSHASCYPNSHLCRAKYTLSQTQWLLVHKRIVPNERQPRPAKVLLTFADKGRCMVSATDP